MGLDRRGREVHGLADRRGRLSLGDPAQDLVFAWAQPRALVVLSQSNLGNECVLDLVGEQGPVVRDGNDGAGEIVGAGRPQQARGGAEPREVVGLDAAGLCKEDDQPSGEPLGGDQGEQPFAAESGKGNVDDCDVEALVAKKSQRSWRVAGLAAELQLWMLADHSARGIAEQRLRVEHGDVRVPQARIGSRCWSCHGGRGCTVRAGSESVYAQLASHYYEHMSVMPDARPPEHQTGGGEPG